MKLFERLKTSLPVLRIPQSCEACGQSFACEIGLTGCWCLHVKLSAPARQALRAKYRRCLCRDCLGKAELAVLEA